MPRQSAAPTPKVRAKRVQNKPKRTTGGLRSDNEVSPNECGRFCLNYCPPIRSLGEEYDAVVRELETTRRELETTRRELDRAKTKADNMNIKYSALEARVEKCESEAKILTSEKDELAEARFKAELEVIALKNKLEQQPRSPNRTPVTTPVKTSVTTPVAEQKRPPSGPPSVEHKRPKARSRQYGKVLRNLDNEHFQDINTGGRKRKTTRS